ncbi:hypothetical protein ACTJKC_08745 [Pedobacter sp. 22226]|uniref:hypothetical protein n=1 Tax=Pedobacter sp. 22226 TaxID=3453894 RepID=UPI003F869EC3
MKQLAQSLFSLLFIATGAIAQERTIKSADVAREGYKDPPEISVKIQNATYRTTITGAIENLT